MRGHEPRTLISYFCRQSVNPPDLKEGLAYFAAINALAANDIEVHRLILEVGKEPLRSRVLAELRKYPGNTMEKKRMSATG
jgi:hypothetical protein